MIFFYHLNAFVRCIFSFVFFPVFFFFSFFFLPSNCKIVIQVETYQFKCQLQFTNFFLFVFRFYRTFQFNANVTMWFSTDSFKMSHSILAKIFFFLCLSILCFVFISMHCYYLLLLLSMRIPFRLSLKNVSACQCTLEVFTECIHRFVRFCIFCLLRLLIRFFVQSLNFSLNDFFFWLKLIHWQVKHYEAFTLSFSTVFFLFFPMFFMHFTSSFELTQNFFCFSLQNHSTS